MKEKTSAGAARNLSKKLHHNDILRKFAFGKAVVRDCLQTLRIEMTSITLPFDSRKSRKLKRISQRIASDVHALYMAWAAPAVLLIRVVREPTWAKCRRVCPRLLFLLIAIMPMAATAQNSLHAESIRTYKLKNSKTHSTMPQIIKSGGGLFSKGELLRINPSNNTIEVSANGGRSWSPRDPCRHFPWSLCLHQRRPQFLAPLCEYFLRRLPQPAGRGQQPACQHHQGTVLLHEWWQKLGEEIIM